MAHLMLVEDDEAIGSLLESALRANGHTLSWQRTGASALAEASSTTLELVLLDLGLPDMDGVDVCRRLRSLLPDTVIVMITARTDEMDVVIGLEAGADDYLTKPFGRTELLARVRAHLRRERSVEQPVAAFDDGDLRIDPVARRCLVGGIVVNLRPKEFDLLTRLVRAPGQAVSRQTLMEDVWDEHWFGSSKTLDVHVAALRRRLTAAADAVAEPVRLPEITTLRGYGYRLDPVTASPD